MKPVTDWESRYQSGETGWDIGQISTPLKEYFDQLADKSIKILIPGCGNAYEASYLHEQGFKNVFLLDLAASPLKDFANKHPDFPSEHLIQDNFFDHEGRYDLIVEQTFFCAINPQHRADYAKKTAALLKPKGKLIGLLWSVPLNDDKPPFGGSKAEYHEYFDPFFDYPVFEKAHNSIKPRADRELFIIAQKKEKL